MENLAFTNRVISTLKTNHKNNLFRFALIHYLVNVNRVFYCEDSDYVFVNELDGMHLGWYINSDFKRIYK